ncbi:hypothetical protein JYQ62_10630 [Nostoc sp. UHCC 0702]|nr:hypothetical protein JYQ62_10630 [Nostoc sp. UHCC 0702]
MPSFSQKVIIVQQTSSYGEDWYFVFYLLVYPCWLVFEKSWINTIVAHQSTQVKKVDEQAIAQLELDRYIEAQASAIAPELKAVEITFFDHEYYAGEKLVAAISYDHDLTQP